MTTKKEKELLGVIPRERIRTLEIPRPSAEVISQYLKLGDMSGGVARTLDELGVVGAIPSVTLRPLIAGKKVVGPAITVRHVPGRYTRHYSIMKGMQSYQKGDNEAYFVGEPGDVVVIDAGGLTNASSMGGGSASIGKKYGTAGSIVDGVCTGIPGIIKADYPVWCRGGTTLTGHHRLETIEINGTVSCAGVQVQPGDLIAADDTGIAVVPSSLITEVLRVMKGKPRITNPVELMEKGARPSEIGKEVAKYG